MAKPDSLLKEVAEVVVVAANDAATASTLQQVGNDKCNNGSADKDGDSDASILLRLSTILFKKAPKDTADPAAIRIAEAAKKTEIKCSELENELNLARATLHSKPKVSEIWKLPSRD